MDKYDLLEAMNGIRDEYIEEASRTSSLEEGVAPAAASDAGTVDHRTEPAGRPGQEKKKKTGLPKKILKFQRWAGTAAAILFVSILLPNMSPDASSAFQGIPLLGNYFRAVTFRSWQYRDDKSDAYVEEPGIITMKAEEDSPEQTGSADPDAGAALASGAGDPDPVPASGGLAMQEFDAKESGDYDSMEMEEADEEEEAEGSVADDADASVRAATSASKINETIRSMAAEEIERFEKSVEVEVGYQSLRFLHRVVTDSDTWFCLEVLAYTSAADGYEEVTHFNIDKKTGAWASLPDLFAEGADYVTPISDNIKAQMRAQMDADPDVEYWLEPSAEEPDEVFEAISPDQDYYINDGGDLVICFNEMEAAPLYMGTREFVIPAEVTSAAGMK